MCTVDVSVIVDEIVEVGVVVSKMVDYVNQMLETPTSNYTDRTYRRRACRSSGHWWRRHCLCLCDCCLPLVGERYCQLVTRGFRCN